MSEKIIRGLHAIEVPLGYTDAHACFDYIPERTQAEARESAIWSYGEPAKGLMLLRDGERWATSDGISPGSGQPWEDEDIAHIRSQVDELIVLD